MTQYNLTQAEAERLAAERPDGINVLPLCRNLPADLLTPVAAYLRLTHQSPADAFLLESIEGGERLARYSFLGTHPFRTLRVRGEAVWVSEGGGETLLPGPPLEVLRAETGRYRTARLPDLPRFTGGAVGYLGYDAVRWVERIPDRTARDLETDDAVLSFFRHLVVFDHLRQRVQLVANLFLDEGPVAEQYPRAAAALAELERRLAGPLPPPPAGAAPAGPVESNLSREAFQDRVRTVQELIRQGEIFQCVLSQRFRRPLAGEPFQVYRALRTINPSPYMFFLKMGATALAGASPEMLVRLEPPRVATRPIAGTRPRGRDEAEDRALAAELAADPKERAEHLMLVDLGRNDLGRVCRPGTVRVERFMTVERYSHVMHLISDVRGELAPGQGPLDALLACFPAGTVTGAPKIRAMEIIDDLEPTRRGPYGGTVFYLDFSGALDSCLTIRTVCVQEGTAWVQAGAGVVADSVPEREFEETVNKAQGMLTAVEQAATLFGGGAP